MSRTLSVLLVLLAAVPAVGFQRKAKVDPARAKHLLEVLRADPDERKRKAAVAELKDADPRAHTDVILGLVASLQRDAAPAVRADAADAIRQFKTIYPLAGLALETAAESDPSAHVRDAAKQALWEYHLAGYRSAKGADGFAGQTPEPPIAKPPLRGGAKTAVASVVIPAAASKPVEVISLAPPALATPPVVVPPPEPGVRTIVSSLPPPVLNVTAEPPIAKPVR